MLSLTAAGRLTVQVHEHRPITAPCGACGGTGKREPVRPDGKRLTMCAPAEYMEAYYAREAALLQGVCLACRGAGKVVLRCPAAGYVNPGA